MPFLVLDSDRTYANLAELDDHLDSLLNPPTPSPVPADVGERGPRFGPAEVQPALPVSEQGVGPATTPPFPPPSSPWVPLPQGPAAPTPAPTPAPLSPVTAPLVAPGGGGPIASYIRQSAAARGIDPNTAVRVAQSEGGLTDPVAQSNFINPDTGKREQSFGPFQLFLGGGLGNAALQAGIDPRNPDQWRQAVDFALDSAARGGWGPFHGAARVGIGNFEGINPGQAIGGAVAGAGQSAQDILNAVQPFLGQKYVWGGASPTQGGTDCSGFVSWLLGMPQRGSTQTLYSQSSPVKGDPQPGDLVFWNMGQDNMHLQHVGEYLGNGQVVQDGGSQSTINIADIGQQIGSPPEFRRMGTDGVPAGELRGEPAQWSDPSTEGHPQQMSAPAELRDHLQTLLGSGMQAVGQAASDVQTQLGQHLSDLSGGAISLFGGTDQQNDQGGASQTPQTPSAAPPVLHVNPVSNVAVRPPVGISGPSQGAGPEPALSGSQPVGAPPAPPDGSQPSMWDRLGQGLSDVFRNVFGGGGGASVAPTSGPPTTEFPGVGTLAGGVQVPGVGTFGAPSGPTAAETLGGAAQTVGQAVGGAATAFMQPPTAAQQATLDQMTQRIRQSAAAPDPYRDIVQEGIPSIIQGAQTGNIGQVLSGALQVLGGVSSGLPGGEGHVASSALTGALEGIDRLSPPPIARAMTFEGGELLGPRGAQPGQLQFGSELPVGGPRPAGTEAPLPAGAQPGQLQFESQLPVGGPAPAARELLGPSGAQPGQASLGLAVEELHPRIQELLGDQPEYARIAQDGLNDLAASGADPAALGRYWAGLQSSAGVPTGISAMDWIRALRNGALAGGLQTMGHVALSVPLQTLWSIPRESIASVLRGQPEQIPAMVAGTFKGFSAGWEVAAQQLRYGITAAQAATGDISGASLALQAGSRLEAGAYTALQGLVGTHGIAQDMLQNVGFLQKLTEQAWTMAKNEGLSGDAFAQRVEDIVKNAAVDPQYQDLLANAQNYASRMAFRGPQGRLGEATAAIARAGIAGNLLVPFQRLAYGVLTQGVERTPLGVAGTALDVARANTPLGRVLGAGPYAPGGNVSGAVTPLAERAANNLLGLGVLAFGLEAASLGWVTDGGPTDPAALRDLRDQGWQPDSFNIAGRYVSGHMFGPLFYPFAAAASIVDARRYGKPGDTGPQIADALQRMGAYLTNETWLRGVAQITDALNTPGSAGDKLTRLVANTAESFVPESALGGNVEQATDPYAREAARGDILQQIQAKYPGLAGQLPAQVSLLGQPVQNPNQGLGVLVPTGRGQPSPTIGLLTDAGVALGAAPKTLSLPSGANIQLNPDEQRQYEANRGALLQRMTAGLVGNDRFAASSLVARRQTLERIVSQADTVAGRQVIAELARTGALAGRVQTRAERAQTLVQARGSQPLPSAFRPPTATPATSQFRAPVPAGR